MDTRHLLLFAYTTRERFAQAYTKSYAQLIATTSHTPLTRKTNSRAVNSSSALPLTTTNINLDVLKYSHISLGDTLMGKRIEPLSIAIRANPHNPRQPATVTPSVATN